MMAAMPFHAVSLTRASGVLMLLFTDRYYRSCAAHAGREPWSGPRSAVSLMLLTAGHVFSRRSSARTVRRITERFLRFAELPLSASRFRAAGPGRSRTRY
jgi:hypothetical protein